MHIVKNYMVDAGSFDASLRIPLILGIWGGKGQGKSFQTELALKKLGWDLKQCLENDYALKLVLKVNIRGRHSLLPLTGLFCSMSSQSCVQVWSFALLNTTIDGLCSRKNKLEWYESVTAVRTMTSVCYTRTFHSVTNRDCFNVHLEIFDSIMGNL